MNIETEGRSDAVLLTTQGRSGWHAAETLRVGEWVRVNVASTPVDEAIWVVRKVEFVREVGCEVDLVVEYHAPFLVLSGTLVEVVPS